MNNKFTRLIWNLNECERVGYSANDVYKETGVFSRCYIQMVNESTPDPDMLRVQINPWGKFDIVDFTTARRMVDCYTRTSRKKTFRLG